MKTKYLKSKVGITPNQYLMVRIKANYVDEKLVLTITSVVPSEKLTLTDDMRSLVGKKYANRRQVIMDVMKTMPAASKPLGTLTVEKLQSIAAMLREIKKDAIALDHPHRDQRIVNGLTQVKKELTGVIDMIDNILGEK